MFLEDGAAVLFHRHAVICRGDLVLGVEVEAASRKFKAAMRRRTAEPCRLAGGFLGRVDVFVAVPVPLGRQIVDRPELVGQIAVDQRGFKEPGFEDPVNGFLFPVRTLDLAALRIGLAIEAAAGIVVGRAVAGRDVSRDQHAAGDFREDLGSEVGKPDRGLLRLHLLYFPAVRQHLERAGVDRHPVVERQVRNIFGVESGRIRVHHGRKVGCGFRRSQHGQHVSPKLREQRQSRCQLGNAADLAGPVGAEQMQHATRRNKIVGQVAEQVAGMLPQPVIRDRVLGTLKDDAVDRVRREVVEVRCRDAVGLDRDQVELHAGPQRALRGELGERLAVGDFRDAHRPQLLCELDGPRPFAELAFDELVHRLRQAASLQPRAGADQVVRQRQHQAAGVAVVADLVAGPVPQSCPDLGSAGRGGRECVGVRPVIDVVDGGLCRVPFGAQSGDGLLAPIGRGGRPGERVAKLIEDCHPWRDLERSDGAGRLEAPDEHSEPGLLGRRFRGEVAVGLDLVPQGMLFGARAILRGGLRCDSVLGDLF